MTISTGGRDRRATVWNVKRVSRLELIRVRAEKIESGLVADSGLIRLFLVGWDVPALCAQFPVLPGVRR